MAADDQITSPLSPRQAAGAASCPRIGIVVERRYLTQLQPAGMMAALKERGCEIEVIDPEAGCYQVGDDRWLRELDLIACRGRSVGLLSYLHQAGLLGKITVNKRDAIASVLDKARMTISLEAARIPTPAAFLGPVRELAAKAPKESYPLMLKPVFGDNCRGLQIVADAGEMARVEWPEPVALAQHFTANDGWDLKLYGIGQEVWAVRKNSCLIKKGLHPAVARREEEVCPIPIGPELKTLAQRCAAIFGLELYGVDCVETAEGPQVIEVNDFPNYTGVAGADAKLADYLIRRLRATR